MRMEERPPFYEVQGPESADPVRAVIRCIEHGAGALLFDRGALPGAFFDLSTGLAGEVAQKLSNYGLRMVGVVPDLAAHSPRFQEFAKEANQGRQLRFVATRAEAIAWLERRERSG
jgi:hypothetical protein